MNCALAIKALYTQGILGLEHKKKIEKIVKSQVFPSFSPFACAILISSQTVSRVFFQLLLYHSPRLH